MKRGDTVLVKAYPNEELTRIVWEEGKTYVAVCRKDVFGRAMRTGTEPESMMGFPKSDVKPIPASMVVG